LDPGQDASNESRRDIHDHGSLPNTAKRQPFEHRETPWSSARWKSAPHGLLEIAFAAGYRPALGLHLLASDCDKVRQLEREWAQHLEEFRLLAAKDQPEGQDSDTQSKRGKRAKRDKQVQ